MTANLAASIRQRLLNRARQEQVPFDAVLNRFGREQLLYRIGISEYSQQFLLKGAMLFALWYDMPHRPTRDMDLLGFGAGDLLVLEGVFREISQQAVDDGLRFSESVQVEEIRKEASYAGARVTLNATLDQARIPLQVDIGFGDAVTPAAEEVDYPVLLEDLLPPRLGAYPIYTVIAEKLEAIVQLGMVNSRLKDYFDLQVLLAREQLDRETLARAVLSTFVGRATPLPQQVPMGLSPEYGEDPGKQKQWQAFLQRNELSGSALPEVVTLLREGLM
ncbi:nucleotidyl transferase AbiEii/AbiGii toxin family protein [Cyanobium sp. WAJ14-Wanaka]|uniref:nucleotidyl transferase AbiEii/AbiGii toxin family protein n=1 Tax=Cyanobium sp. WAJ14-Wanaka TaxID=2823725 RepID=UPI0020CBCB88|nr:nucleotidyl transferase AbiEii/AbiGii toxin family protein [Cyanobium sp. WAJ14-Wanaka]MCP9774975.1 nucleotidyl transferase AbiEii/AbiGii toxin family protein [Cyanobium sp. WAJ14-Wanaka]